MSLTTADGSRSRARSIDLVYRRVLFNDILAHPDACRALVEAYRARTVCMANTFRCKVPHKKAFFAVLTDERFRHLFTPAERELDAAAHSLDAARRGADDGARRPDD